MEAATPSSAENGPQEPSSVDAMGQDKRREVIGHSYGPTKKRQLAYYGIFVALVVVGYLGFQVAVKELDKAPATNPDKAPWSQGNAPNDQSGRGFFAPEQGNGVASFE
ncbi:MAG: hypothetical protein AABM29_08385 [Actinomycetota bacterium]